MADDTQLNINQQINKLLSDRLALMKSQETLLNSQVSLATALCNALECGSLEDLEKRLNGVRDILSGVKDDSEDFSGNIEKGADNSTKSTMNLSEALEEMKNRLKETHPVLMGIATGFGVGFVRGLGSAWQTIKNLNMGLFDIISTLGKFALSILAIPFKILEGLFDLAQGSGGGPSPIKVELENIRKEFGSLATNEGKAVAGSLKEIRKEYSNVAKTGLSVRQIFGPGLEGMAKMLAENTELAKALGSSLTSLRDLIDQNGNALMVYRKGMGLTSEQEGFIIKNANFMGKKPMDVMRQFASMSIRMGDQFGINAKIISKSMAELATDLAHFGSLGPKTLGSVATYAHKLGIEIKDLAGIMDAFDDFEGAATASAKLAQSLNMNVGALDMLETEDPAQRVEYLRQRFRESGNTYEQLSRQQKKYLQSTANLSEGLAAAAFGQGNINKSYKEFQNASAAAEKKVMTQEEAMKRLASSIERVFGSGGGSKFKSFFDAFTSGFASGIMRSHAFRRAMRSLNRAIRAVFLGGRQVGLLFVKYFPGVKKFFVGLADLFSPRRFRGLMKGVVGAFKDLFQTLRTDPKAGIEKFLKTFKELLKNFFMKSGPGAKAVMDGAKDFLKTLYAIFQAVFPMVLDAIAAGANAITEFLSNPPDLTSPLSKAFDNVVNALIPMFVMIGEKLGPPFSKLFDVLWEKAKPFVVKWALIVLGAAIAKIIISSLWGAFIGAIGAASGQLLARGAIKLLKKIFGFEELAEKVKKPPVTPPDTGKPGTSGGKGWIKFFGYLALVLLAVGALMIVYKFLNMTVEDAIGVSIILVASITSAALVALSLKLLPDNINNPIKKLAILGLFMAAIATVAVVIVNQLAGIQGKENLLYTAPAFMMVMAGLVMGSIPLLLASIIIGKMGEATAAAAVEGMVVVGGFMVALGALGVIITSVLSLFNPESVKGAAFMMAAMSFLMLSIIPMLPIAFALGSLAAAEPFGLVGLAIIGTGFLVIAGIMTMLIETLLPAIYSLTTIILPSPDSFKAVVGALIGMIDSITKFVAASSLLSFSLRPTQNIDESSFKQNIDSFASLINTIIGSGFGKIINDLIEFAKTANVKEGTGEVITAIGSVLNAAATIMQAFSPDAEAGKAIMMLEGLSMVLQATGIFGLLSGGGQGGSGMMAHVERTMIIARESMERLLPAMSGFITGLVTTLSSIRIPKGVERIGPLLSAVASMIGALSNVMNFFKKNEETITGTVEYLLMFGVPAIGALRQVQMDRAKQLEESSKMGKFIAAMSVISGAVISIINGIKGPITEMIKSVSNVPTESLKVIIPLIGDVLNFASGLASSIGPIIQGASSAISDVPAPQKAAAFTNALGSIAGIMMLLGPTLTTLIDPMKLMINAVLNIAKGIKDTRGLKAKVEVVSATLQAVGAMTEIFKAGGSLSAMDSSGKINDQVIKNMGEVMNLVTNNLLKSDGPLKNMAEALGKMNLGDTRKIKGAAAAVKSIGEGVGAIAEAFDPSGGIVTFGSTKFGKDTGIFESIRQKIDLFTIGEGKGIFAGMRNVVNQVPEGVADRSESIKNMVSTLAALSTSMTEVGLTSGDISSFVQLNNALRGDSTLKVEHKNLNITMNVHVEMSAEQIASGIIRVNDINTGVPGRQRFVIETK